LQMQILYAVIALGGMGLAFGLVLALASKYLSTEQDERVPMIMEILPNANCGGCGYAGCSAYAQAVVAGNASTSACPVGGAKLSAGIAEIMGVSADVAEVKVAKVLCVGKTDKTTLKYHYEGIEDCFSANRIAKGPKNCEFACVGYGSCVQTCPFDAIVIEDGIAVVDSEKCVACGRCVKICPKQVIELVPKSASNIVLCSSKDKGAVVKSKCSVGCISCKICEKACAFDAITVTDNLAKIDYSKCTRCGECAKKCPTKVISIQEQSNE